MLPFFRRLIRIPILLVWFALLGFISLFLVIGGWCAVRRMTRMARIWGSGIARIIGLKVKVYGDPSKVHGGIIVSNHQSYLDIITHSSVFPIRFSPKREIASWPFLGWYLALSRPIWINRESKQDSIRTLEQYKKTLENDINLIVYPEGTTSDGKGILPFKSTPFEAASAGNFTIFPILIRYIQDPSEYTVGWYGDMTLLPHCWYVIGRKVTNVEIYILDPILPEGKNRKELAVFIHDLMEKEYDKVNGGKASGHA